MPKYSFRCPKCGKVTVLFRSVDSRDSKAFCICHRKPQLMERVADVPAVYPQGLSNE